MNTVDAIVVGGGFNWIYASWRLARDGISVALSIQATRSEVFYETIFGMAIGSIQERIYAEF